MLNNMLDSEAELGSENEENDDKIRHIDGKKGRRKWRKFILRFKGTNR